MVGIPLRRSTERASHITPTSSTGCYAYPVPDGFAGQPVEPEAARFDGKLGEFLLPYEAVCSADDPETALMRFLQSTYEAAATTGRWDRRELESHLGVPRVPRLLDANA